MVRGVPRVCHYCFYYLFTTLVAIFGYVDLNTPGALTTLLDVFDTGYALSKDLTFLGHRPVISKSPLKYADHFVWQTYAQVDERRRNLGSAIHTLFENGTVGGRELPTVGLWSPNRPGKSLIYPPYSPIHSSLALRQSGWSSSWH